MVITKKRKNVQAWSKQMAQNRKKGDHQLLLV